MDKKEKLNELKKVNEKEVKKNLLQMLQCFDKICRDNNIKYTLIGGSLIGAIRHKGIIPWDDDIDVVLTFEEYNKLIKVIKNKNKYGDYVFMDNSTNPSYYYPFVKLVDTKTIVIENRAKPIDNYGIFIDIFYYNNVPKNIILQKIYWYKIMFGIAMISGYATTEYKKNDKYYLAKQIGKLTVKIFGIKKCIAWFNKNVKKYNNKKTGIMVVNWPSYGIKREFMKDISIDNYIDCEFDGITSMITTNYDKILKTTYGDYMKLPPVDQRYNHNMQVYKK